jgi:membrane protein DedA with SNARE-associated domain
MSLELVSLETIQAIVHEYGYWTVFFGIMLENAGIPLPGETITVVGGFLAGSGELNYWWVLGSAIVGAVIGDNFGYWIGYFGGWTILTLLGRLFRLQEQQLIDVRDRFAKNAAKAVFLGRFVALLRIFAGPLAGTAKMPYLKFLACNLSGAAVWASVTISLAYFVGRLVPLEQLIAWMAQFTIAALALVAVWISLSYWLDHRAKRLESNG